MTRSQTSAYARLLISYYRKLLNDAPDDPAVPDFIRWETSVSFRLAGPVAPATAVAASPDYGERTHTLPTRAVGPDRLEIRLPKELFKAFVRISI